MNVNTYNELRNHELELFRSGAMYVTPKTLFGKKCYKDLTLEEKRSRVIQDGWRWDSLKEKYYKEITQ